MFNKLPKPKKFLFSELQKCKYKNSLLYVKKIIWLTNITLKKKINKYSIGTFNKQIIVLFLFYYEILIINVGRVQHKL